MKIFISILSLLIFQHAHAGCPQSRAENPCEEMSPGQAVSYKEEFEGKKYFKVVICEKAFIAVGEKDNAMLLPVVCPMRCLTQAELYSFIDAKPHVMDSLQTMGFKNRADLNAKTEAFTAQFPGQGVCPSGEIDESAPKRMGQHPMESAASHVARLYNIYMGSTNADGSQKGMPSLDQIIPVPKKKSNR